MTDQWLMIWAMLVPILGAFIIARLDRFPNFREAITLMTSITLISIVVTLYWRFADGEDLQLLLAEPMPGLKIAFDIDSLGIMFALLASLLWLATSIYAIGYMRGHHEKNQTRFFAFFALAISAVMAVTMAANLFTLFLFYEMLTLLTYPLVTHSDTPLARQRGRMYLGILMGTSIGLFLFAMLIVWQQAGTLDFTQGGVLKDAIDPQWVLPLYLMFLFGISKAGVMPFHKWLPAAMVAPTPVSALLHAVAVVKAGVFSLLKVTLFIFGPEFLTESGANQILIWLPLSTILIASLIAMTKDNLKERLAYSTVSQLSYIVLGTIMATPAALLGASMHIVMHAVAKISLFFAAGAILVATHKTNVSQLNGLGRQMPVTFAIFALASISIVGLPPLAGLWSKWFLASGSIGFSEQPLNQWLILITLVISSLLNIAYLLVIPVKAFFGGPAHPTTNTVNEAPLACMVGLLLPALLCVWLFFEPDLVYRLSLQAVSGSSP